MNTEVPLRGDFFLLEKRRISVTMGSMSILQIILTFLLPTVIYYAVQRNKVCDIIGPVVLAYASGVLLGNFLPLDHKTSELLTEISVPLALPLLLFAYPILGLIRQAPKSLKAFGVSTLSVALVALGVSLFSSHPENWKIAGMLVGVYTGGTPNLTSIGLALETSGETLVLLQTADLILGGLYLMILLTVLHRFLLLFLPAFETEDTVDMAFEENAKITLWPALFALGLSIGVVGLSVQLSFLIFGKISPPFVFFGLTTLSLLLSLWPKVSTLKCAYPMGNYLILVFCIAIGQMIKFETLVSKSYDVFWLCTLVMAGTLVLNFVLSKLFRVDADNTMMASTAAIYGPAFVGPVAQTMKNPAMIGPGLLMGLLGYALGNYLGLLVAYLARYLLT